MIENKKNIHHMVGSSKGSPPYYSKYLNRSFWNKVVFIRHKMEQKLTETGRDYQGLSNKKCLFWQRRALMNMSQV